MWVCTFSCVSVLNLIYYFSKHGDVRAEVIILQVTTLKSCDHSRNSQVDNMSALTQSQFKTSSHFKQFLKKIWTVLHIPSLNDILNDELPSLQKQMHKPVDTGDRLALLLLCK